MPSRASKELNEPGDKLNKQQRMFADEYLIDLNATQAAIRAGYSENTAYSQGQRLLKHVEVKSYLKQRMQAIDDDRLMKRDEVLFLLTSIARGESLDMKEVTLRKTDFVDDPNGTGEKIPVQNDYVEKIFLTPKNSDRIKALDTLGKYFSLWTEKKEIHATITPVFIDDIEDIGDDDE